MTVKEYYRHGGDSFKISKKITRTRYVMMLIRIEIFNGLDPDDLAIIHKIQVNRELIFENIQIFTFTELLAHIYFTTARQF